MAALDPHAPSLNASGQPDFRVYTAGMEADEANPELPIVRMIGSSTEKDLQRDTMLITALSDMTLAEKGLLIWLNHDYTVPHSLFGSLADVPELHQKDGIADLTIAVEVELDSPDAAKTYQLIKKGRKFGCSVGCVVEEYAFDDDGGDSWCPPMLIVHVRVVEWSVVGVPANQRSWVENAMRGLFTRQVSEGYEPDEKLARAVKSLWPHDYERVVQSVPDPALRKHLAGLPERPLRQKANILWDPAKKQFLLNDAHGRRKTLEDRTSVARLIDEASRLAIEAKSESTAAALSESDDMNKQKSTTTEPVTDIVPPVAPPVVAPESTTSAPVISEVPAVAPVAPIVTPAPADAPTPDLGRASILASANTLLEIIGLPPVDDAGKQASAPTSHEEVEHILTHLFAAAGIVIKEGAKLSKDDKKTAQIIHDSINAMADNSLCASTSSEESKSMKSASHLPTLVASMDSLATVLKGFDAKTMNTELEAARAQLDQLKKSIEENVAAAATTKAEIEKTREMPLGRPTGFNRSLANDPAAASHEELRSALSPSVPMPGAENSVKYVDGIGNCRVWGEGSIDTRPGLSTTQKSIMSIQDIYSYEHGGPASVPIL